MSGDQTLTLHEGRSSVSSSSFPKAVVIIQTFHQKSIVSFEMGAVVGTQGRKRKPSFSRGGEMYWKSVSLHRK